MQRPGRAVERGDAQAATLERRQEPGPSARVAEELVDPQVRGRGLAAGRDLDPGRPDLRRDVEDRLEPKGGKGVGVEAQLEQSRALETGAAPGVMTTFVAVPERSRSRPSVTRSSGRTCVTIGSSGSVPLSTSRIAAGNVKAVMYVPSTDSERSVIVYCCTAGRAVWFIPNSAMRPPSAACAIAVPSWLPTASTRTSAPSGSHARRRTSSSSGLTTRSAPTAVATATRVACGSTTMTGLAPAALNIARKRQPIAPAPKMIADSPGRGLALLTLLTTQARGSMSDAIADDGASDSGNVNSAGALISGARAPCW